MQVETNVSEPKVRFVSVVVSFIISVVIVQVL